MGNEVSTEGAKVEANRTELARKSKSIYLAQAAKDGDVKTLEALAASGADLKALGDGSALIMLAAEAGHSAFIAALVAGGADLNSTTTTGGLTALMIAAQNGNISCVVELLKLGSEPNAAMTTGWTALMSAAQKGHSNCIEALIKQGAKVNAVDTNKSSALLVAAQKGHIDCVRVLLGNGADASMADSAGRNVLISAALFQHPKCVRALLSFPLLDLDVNKEDSLRRTALSYASQHGDNDSAKLLLNKGATVETYDSRGWNPLLFAVKGGYSDLVALLLEHGANANAALPNGTTALMLASARADAECLHLLIQHGADQAAKNNDGKTAWNIAVAGASDREALRKLEESEIGVLLSTQVVSPSTFSALPPDGTAASVEKVPLSTDTPSLAEVAVEFLAAEQVELLEEEKEPQETDVPSAAEGLSPQPTTEEELGSTVASVFSLPPSSPQLLPLTDCPPQDFDLAKIALPGKSAAPKVIQLHVEAHAEQQSPKTLLPLPPSEVFSFEIPFEGLKREVLLGKGTYGNVYSGRWNDQCVAIHYIESISTTLKSTCDTDKVEATTRNEVTAPMAPSDPGGPLQGDTSSSVLSASALSKMAPEIDALLSLEGPHIVGFLGLCREPVCIVTELALPGKSLADLLELAAIDTKVAEQLTWARRLRMAADAAWAMRKLHQRTPPVLHRDLSPSNLLVGSDWRVKLTGLAGKLLSTAVFYETSSTLGGIPAEIMQEKEWSPEADVYCFGSSVLWQLLTWQPSQPRSPSLLKTGVFGSASNHASPGGLSLPAVPPAGDLPGPAPKDTQTLPRYVKLWKQCTAKDPSMRPSFSHILKTLKDLAIIEKILQHEDSAAGHPCDVWSLSSDSSM